MAEGKRVPKGSKKKDRDGAAEVAKRIEQYQRETIHRVKLAITDVDGVLRGKYVDLHKFASIAQSHGGFCDCVFGWDIEDQLYDNASFTGWHTAYPDALYKLDADTERRLPDENVPFFIGEFVDSDGHGLHPVCPRSLLRRVLGFAESMGYGAIMAAEYEFFIFDETPHSIREKGYRGLRPLTPGMFGYSVLRNSRHSDLFNGLMDYCLALEIPLEGLHCETGPGVWEAAIRHDDALKAADKASLFKTFSKVFFQKQGLLATFMAKWSMEYPGQSGHIHQSLYDRKTGAALFYDVNGRAMMSKLMESYVAGLQKYLRPFLALCAPTINAYTRLVPGAWAPTTATWGVENRTCALRVIGGSEKAQRVEFRVGSADANPYLAMAANLAAGLLGVREKLTLGDPVVGNAYEVEDRVPPAHRLPSNLRDSVRDLAESREAREAFGADFVEHFVATREWEVRQYEKAVTDWQLRRYFEIV
ncbi:MAG: glutamine synthetase [Myxococcales bacterium]|nr:glutamine synthetase [Myxococcales bacterium]